MLCCHHALNPTKCCSASLINPALQAVQPWRSKLARCPANSDRGCNSAEGNCLVCREGHRD